MSEDVDELVMQGQLVVGGDCLAEFLYGGFVVEGEMVLGDGSGHIDGEKVILSGVSYHI